MLSLCIFLALLGLAASLRWSGRSQQSLSRFSLAAKRRTKATVKRSDAPSTSSSASAENSLVQFISSRENERSTPERVSEDRAMVTPSRGDVTTLTDDSLQELLKNDFKGMDSRTSSTKKEQNPVFKIAKDVFGAVLIADFFAVIVFLIWFLLGAALQTTNVVVLERFQDIFQPVVVPCLTVLMVGSFLSGTLNKDDKQT